MTKRTRPARRKKEDAGLQAAIIAAGGVTKLAALLGIKHPNLWKWKRAPAERVPAISEITGIPRHVLRPDLWEPPSRKVPRERRA
jgi:DNA-binding transcriptional regulator YdaS (Cro superfamily)